MRFSSVTRNVVQTRNSGHVSAPFLVIGSVHAKSCTEGKKLHFAARRLLFISARCSMKTNDVCKTRDRRTSGWQHCVERGNLCSSQCVTHRKEFLAVKRERQNGRSNAWKSGDSRVTRAADALDYISITVIVNLSAAGGRLPEGNRINFYNDIRRGAAISVSFYRRSRNASPRERVGVQVCAKLWVYHATVSAHTTAYLPFGSANFVFARLISRV